MSNNVATLHATLQTLRGVACQELVITGDIGGPGAGDENSNRTHTAMTDRRGLRAPRDAERAARHVRVPFCHHGREGPIGLEAHVGPSLRDVAAAAGVSVRTVSNVVNDFPHVAPETRRRVQQALEELRYRPNLAARSLRRGRSGLIALVVPQVAAPYFGELASHLVEEAEARGWMLLVDQTGGLAERERRLLEGERAHLVDGVIFSPLALTPAQLSRHRDTLPLVLVGERSSDGLVDHIAVDNVAAAAEATEHLLALGRRRIAAVGTQPRLGNDTARQRLEGYRRAVVAAGIEPDRALEVPVTELRRSDGAAAVRRLLRRADPPDAVFCFSDELALGALRAAADLGVRVPDDLAIVGFDDVEDGRYANPSLSTIAPDKREIARRALECLADRLDNDAAGRPARSVVAGHRLVVRESTAKPDRADPT